MSETPSEPEPLPAHASRASPRPPFNQSTMRISRNFWTCPIWILDPAGTGRPCKA